MGRKQVLFQTNIDWYATAEKLKVTCIPYPQQITGKGHIKIKLDKYKCILLISPKGTLQVTYETSPDTASLHYNPPTVLAGVPIARVNEGEVVELDEILREIGCLQTIDGAPLKLEFKKYIHFSSSWKDEWEAWHKLHSETFQESVKQAMDLMKMSDILRRVIFDKRFRSEIKRIIEDEEEENGYRLDSQELAWLLLEKVGSIETR